MFITYRQLRKGTDDLKIAYPRSFISFGTFSGYTPDSAPAVPYFRMMLPIPLWSRSPEHSVTAPWNPRKWRLLSLNWNGISGWFFAPRWRQTAPRHADKYYDPSGRRLAR